MSQHHYSNNPGLDYLARPIGDGKECRKYRHLANMVRKAWDIASYHPDTRFDIDTKFAYQVEPITHYLRGFFAAETINQAHTAVCNDYNNRSHTRGRPQGARNKPKQPASSVMAEVFPENNTPSAAPSLPAPIIEQPSENGAKLDSSEFVLKAVFDNHDNANEQQFAHISKQLLTLDYSVETLQGYARDLNKDIEDVRTNVMAHDARLIALENRSPTIVEIKPYNAPSLSLGMQHMCFPDLLQLCCAAIEAQQEPLNVWLYGPAGTGKTTSAKMISKALAEAYNRPFPFYALSKLSTEFQVLGFNDAHKYVTTMFRQCYEFGGVIILDEIDSWSPNAMTALNGALANGYCAFPDRMVDRHPDCIVIAGANTIGSGGTIEYVGRLKQDAASLDRFEMLEWPIDLALEAALTDNDQWLARVRHVRAMVAKQGIKDVMITPRASIKGAARLRAGVDQKLVEKLFLRRGMTDAQWNMVK